MELTAQQQDRAFGVMLGLASGDALGAGYEFQPPMKPTEPVGMIGGGLGNFAPGEWTDDTSMAVVIAQALQLSGGQLNDVAEQAMTQAWADWVVDAPDAGIQTRAVFSDAQKRARQAGRSISTADLLEATEEIHQRTGRSAGNGSLMRTAPVALCFLDSAEATYQAAVRISALTHFDPVAGEASGLFSVAIRHAVLTGELDIRQGLGFLPLDSVAYWDEVISEAENKEPQDFPKNGWVIQAFQGAWSAIVRNMGLSDKSEQLVATLEAAVRGGVDTDTVAAIAGGLIGAATGRSAFPEAWVNIVHGWPGLDTAGLDALSQSLVSAK